MDEEISKEFDQNEVFEPSQTISSIKNESTDNIEIKMEQTDAEDYSTFISTEYLETLQDDEEGSGDYDESYAEDEEFSFVKKEKHQKSDIVRMKGLKKHYKRFVELLESEETCYEDFLVKKLQSTLRFMWKLVLQRSVATAHRREFQSFSLV